MSENAEGPDVPVEICPECGAPISPKGTCLANFHELLALEWDIPGGPGEVAHFYAVATYGIQHPASMRYTQSTVDGLLDAVRDVLAGRASMEEIRQRTRAQVSAAGHVRRRNGDKVPTYEVSQWRVVVTDVIAGGVDGYQQRVEEWARSVIETIGGDS